MVTPSGDVDLLDRDVRLAVYRGFVEDGRPPTPPEIAGRLDVDVGDVEVSLQRLADRHALVLAPGTSYVWMANPFSAIPTSFAVRTRGRDHWGNCIWDALGIPACLGVDARIETYCPDCADPLALEIRDGRLVPSTGVIHFAVPAARWWEDIGAT